MGFLIPLLSCCEKMEKKCCCAVLDMKIIETEWIKRNNTY